MNVRWLGLFVFAALLGVLNAGIYKLSLSRATAVLEEMRPNTLGANACLLARPVSDNALPSAQNPVTAKPTKCSIPAATPLLRSGVSMLAANLWQQRDHM